jgi:hypothetical protein
VDPNILLAVIAGVVIAAACGLRAFLPLLVLGLAARAGAVELDPAAHWLAGNLALVALSVATVLEVAGDKIPIVDHALDLVGTFVRPAAAWFGASAMFHDWPSPWGPLVSLALAALALGVHAAKAKLRLGTTAMTLGHGNPFVSAIEDVAVLVMTLLAIVLPVVALLFVGLLVWLVLRRARPRPA